MGVSLDLRKAHLHRLHGDLLVVYTWVNDARALVLIPVHRKGAPWYIVEESAAYLWDDSQPGMAPLVAKKAMHACEVLGIEPTAHNAMRVATIIVDGLPDLIRMPAAPEKEHYAASHGQLLLREGGKAVAGEDIRFEKQGATYA